MGIAEPIGRRALLRFALALVAVLVCVACQPPPRPTPARLKVVAVPESTTVYVNGEFAGSAKVLAVKPKAMKPGIKYITFKAPGYFPHDVRLRLPPGETTVEMKLRPIPP
ncbi:MAG: hypothetical protein OEZ06_09955 [Myxococcales bacterium]|nr:hypothetical protein [Myxococcales bacterium]